MRADSAPLVEAVGTLVASRVSVALPGVGWLLVDRVLVEGRRIELQILRDWPELAPEDAEAEAERWWIDGWRTRPNPRAWLAHTGDGFAALLREHDLLPESMRCDACLVVRNPGRFPATDWLRCERELPPCLGPEASAPDTYPGRLAALLQQLEEPLQLPECRVLAVEGLTADGSGQELLVRSAEAGLELVRAQRPPSPPHDLPERWSWLGDRLRAATQHRHLAATRLHWPRELEVGLCRSRWQDTLSLGELADAMALSLAEKLEILYHVSLALQALHRAGIVHQGLDAQALLMADDGVWLGAPALPGSRGYDAQALPAMDVGALGRLVDELLAECLALPPAVLELRQHARDGELAKQPLAAVQERLTGCLPRTEAPTWVPDDEAAHENALLAPGECIGDYRVVRHLHSGGFAQVYEAVHELQDRRCALKVYDAEIADRELIAEFELLQALAHPRIGRVWWSGRLGDGRAYLVLEYLAGEHLGHYAWGEARLSLPEIRQAGLEVLEALAYLHDPAGKAPPWRGRVLYHRDVKPGNIMRVPGRGCVLIDFNVAGTADLQDGFSGTHRYTPPAVASGAAGWDASCDLFGLGITLYELACHCFPWGDEGPSLETPARRPRAAAGQSPLPAAWRSLLWRAVQPREGDRFQSAVAMREALLALPGGDA